MELYSFSIYAFILDSLVSFTRYSGLLPNTRQKLTAFVDTEKKLRFMLLDNESSIS